VLIAVTGGGVGIEATLLSPASTFISSEVER
jgi:hypothetical protein